MGDVVSIEAKGRKKEETKEPLTAKQEKKLAELEKVIDGNLAAFQKVGMALAKIRDMRLYRDNYDGFKTYCRKKWGMSDNYAHKLIKAAAVMENLKVNCTNVQLPSNESQARELSVLSEEDQIKVWESAIDSEPRGGITSKYLSKAVRKFRGIKPGKKPDPVSQMLDKIADGFRNVVTETYFEDDELIINSTVEVKGKESSEDDLNLKSISFEYRG